MKLVLNFCKAMVLAGVLLVSGVALAERVIVYCGETICLRCDLDTGFCVLEEK